LRIQRELDAKISNALRSTIVALRPSQSDHYASINAKNDLLSLTHQLSICLRLAEGLLTHGFSFRRVRIIVMCAREVRATAIDAANRQSKYHRFSDQLDNINILLELAQRVLRMTFGERLRLRTKNRMPVWAIRMTGRSLDWDARPPLEARSVAIPSDIDQRA
jgi:hypothetical protein